tara:strand:- start:5286 stop:5903 length:618 start_codon:yes stop_codon:yes gene_type:complete
MKKILKEWREFLKEAPVIWGGGPSDDDERLKIIGKAMDLVPTVLASGQPVWYETLYDKAVDMREMGSAHPMEKRAPGYGRGVVDGAIYKFKEDHLFAQPDDRQSLFNYYQLRGKSGRWYDGGGGGFMKYDIHRSVERSSAWKNWVKAQQPWKQFFSDYLDGTMKARIKKQGVKGNIVGKLFSRPENFLDMARLINDLLDYNLGDI